MPYRFLVLPFDEATEQFDSGEMGLLEERYDIRQCRASFFQSASGRSYWTAFVEVQRRSSQADDTGIDLDEVQKKRYEGLREWRNTYAEGLGIAPYLIATNRQLKQMTQIETPTLEALGGLRGFGKAKSEKFGTFILQILLEEKAQQDVP
ncbi:MAG: HRDC domain-containing protein [Saprospiraceae bacterium]